VVARPTPKIVSPSASPPRVRDKVCEGEDLVQALKGTLPHCNDVACQLQAVACINAKVLQVPVIAIARLIRTPGAGCILCTEIPPKYIVRTGAPVGREMREVDVVHPVHIVPSERNVMEVGLPGVPVTPVEHTPMTPRRHTVVETD